MMERLDLETLELLKSLDGGKSLLKELIDAYQKEFNGIVEKLELALQKREPSGIRFYAHLLSGKSGNIGLNSIVVLCRELEHLGQQEQIEPAAPILRKLKDEYKLVLAELLPWRESLG